MSRLAGLSVYYRDEEVYTWGWKNNLPVDTLILSFIRENFKGHFEDKSIDYNNTRIIMKYAVFGALVDYLKKTLTLEWWKQKENILTVSVEEAAAQWDRILAKMDWAIQYCYNCNPFLLKAEFFECF